jgi:protein gp37
MVFVNSMSDMFHRDIPDSYLVRIFEVMLSVDRHVYQILTKRPARATRFWKKYAERFGVGEVPPHIWIGVSVEDSSVTHRIRQLRLLPAAVRFLSCEPLLGPIALDLDGIHWVIVGGESGPGHRSLKLPWARAIRDRCLAAGIPFFFKQVGGHTSKAGGRLLDGREWNQYPSDLVPA